MKKKIYTGRLLFLRSCVFIAVCLFFFCAEAQETGRKRTLLTPQPVPADTLTGDSAAVRQDTVPLHGKKISRDAINSTVTYRARDSVVNDLERRFTYLFGDAVVKYEDMELYADFIAIDFRNSELYASGIAAPGGNISGNPVFVQGADQYRAREIKYNFNTHKGKITHVITTQDDGFVHGEHIKKMGDNVAYIKNGKYTTCELDNPHYEIDFTKAKFIQHDKIVMGPAYLSFQGIPTPLAIPFAFFPLETERKSGLVMPTFGESSNLGFYFQDLGFYFAINDNLDLLLSTDLYTRGSWAVKAKSNYVFRYKCNGALNLQFSQTRVGDRLDSSYRCSNDYKIYWDHKQDVKSHPTTRFNAHIDIVSSNYSKYNYTSTSDYLSNQYTSSVNVSTSVKDFFYVDATASYSQNTGIQEVNFKLPDLNMSVVQFYPFRKKDKTGGLKWYDNIAMKWTSQTTGQINTYDTLLFKSKTWEEMDFGMMHTIPLTIPVKIAKLVNWNTTATLVEKWYLQHYTKDMTFDTTGGSETASVNSYFKRGFGALHDLSLSSSLTTKIYVMYAFKKGALNAIRHVITPTLSFTYQPNLSGRIKDTYVNPFTGQEVEYTYYDNSIFGTVTNNTQAVARFTCGNNIEIKVRSRRDTITGYKKIALFDNLNLSMDYNFAADSMNWSRLALNGRSTLFKQLYITFNLSFDPYSINGNGTRTSLTEWKANRRLFRLSSTDVSLALNWTIDQNTFKKKSDSESKTDDKKNRQGWSLTFNYTFSYGINDNLSYYRLLDTVKYTHNMVHTLNVSGTIYVTPKWKVGFNTGYDFVQKSMSYTSIDIYRDMHCWEMSFGWVPFGYRKGWNFTINVKAAVLKDVLKLPFHHDFRDNL